MDNTFSWSQEAARRQATRDILNPVVKQIVEHVLTTDLGKMFPQHVKKMPAGDLKTLVATQIWRLCQATVSGKKIDALALPYHYDQAALWFLDFYASQIDLDQKLRSFTRAAAEIYQATLTNLKAYRECKLFLRFDRHTAITKITLFLARQWYSVQAEETMAMADLEMAAEVLFDRLLAESKAGIDRGSLEDRVLAVSRETGTLVAEIGTIVLDTAKTKLSDDLASLMSRVKTIQDDIMTAYNTYLKDSQSE